jgi:TM2 domain-containing membrane protein YozV
MPEERICPACGRSNALANRTCENCGAAIAGALLLKQQDAARQAAYSSEFPTVRDGSWKGVETDKRGAIPLPPQIQAEARRREQEWERREAEQRAAVARRAETERRIAEERERRRQLAEAVAAAQEQSAQVAGSAVRVCRRCRTAAEPRAAGAEFSFCLKCGADLSDAAVVPAPLTNAAEPRSYREAMLERRARRRVREAVAGTSVRAEQQTAGVHVAEQRAGSASAGGVTVSPLSAAVWSFLLPGVGQMLNGQIAKGVVLLVALWVSLAAFGLQSFGVAMVIGRALVALDAFRIGDRRRRGLHVGAWDWSVG